MDCKNFVVRLESFNNWWNICLQVKQAVIRRQLNFFPFLFWAALSKTRKFSIIFSLANNCSVMSFIVGFFTRVSFIWLVLLIIRQTRKLLFLKAWTEDRPEPVNIEMRWKKGMLWGSECLIWKGCLFFVILKKLDKIFWNQKICENNLRSIGFSLVGKDSLLYFYITMLQLSVI